ncbi:alpha-amylase family protein [Ulvibacterium marinum]|uniref:Alpha-galactosidase n=1 Tax=Ulvibacterium marinum TaxID=2419782 RepID=A0A3B0CAC2_9FLAO|nr:alpha-galactosidase [Ulvibacterium marinum]RKN79756.1 alpha-galactosidase [Ulvibacterium marinum]
MNKTCLLLLGAFWVASLVCYGQDTAKSEDWLLENTAYTAKVVKKADRIILDNGLLRREIKWAPNAATVEFKNLTTGETLLRSLQPEAEVTLNGKIYAIGGLHGLKEHGYLLEEWLDDLNSDPDVFQYLDYTIQPIRPKLKWSGQKRLHMAEKIAPTGKELILIFQHASSELEGVVVEVHYELYDGIPLVSKWIVVQNNSLETLSLDSFKSELLAYPEVENPVETPNTWKRPNLHVESDYAFGGFTSGESNVTTFWETDSTYISQVNWKMETPCLLISKLPIGPSIDLKSGAAFESFRTYELVLDGTDRERNTLAMRKMYRLLAPWSTENPIFMHLTTTDEDKVKEAVDQCEATGYEMVILSFGSGLNMEDNSPENIAKFKALADYAHGKGIELGGYSLFSSRKIADSVDVIDKVTGKPGGAKFGNAPCLASEWGYDYLEKIKFFLEHTGFDLLEHDGPYPGDYCASTTHKYHNGYEDSQWKQWTMTRGFYHWLREKDIYLNAPDFYFLQGSNKCGIGYREVNWSLPRAQQLVLGRQNIYDGTWEKAPSMAWTFVPLTEYHGGGAAATLEPLKDHLLSYEAHMIQNYGSGVQACYRGPRLYDTTDTKSLVIDQIRHYKKYRKILNADLIHLRRPNGRSWDGFMHVDPNGEHKGFVLLFNPTQNDIQEKIKIPLYYTGLTDYATVSDKNGVEKKYELGRNFEVTMEVTIPAAASTWFVIH